jgi:hypothetical protein
MHEFNPSLEAGGGIEPLEQKHDDFKVLETITFYNYFCLKMGCFQAFFGTEKGVIKDCPNCYQNDRVVAKFE